MESAASGGFATGILRVTALYFLGMRRLDFESPPTGGADPRRGGACSRMERALERSGACSREAHPLERDGSHPREALILERGEAYSRGSSSGPPWWAVGAPAAWVVSYMVRRSVFGFVAGFKWRFPGCLRGPLGLSPTVAPEHLWVCH
jgi:hypothetical protein